MPEPVDVPTLDPGLTLLRPPGPRSTAIHRLALATLAESTGVAYWVDARNAASTYTLYDIVHSPRRLRNLRVARAFTAYQHHALGRRVVERVDGRTGLLVAPNVASLYRDEDVPRYERERLLDSTVRTFAALADAREIPTLLSVPAGRDPGPAAEHADRIIRCERTEMGYRFEGPGVETTVYWDEGYWQTTIPYWVDLLGVASESLGPGVDPVGTGSPEPIEQISLAAAAGAAGGAD
ncbi:P-loop NTPase family protein [Halosimplex salinum]|uniref:hypothetical protein n=1 Tax=Halosimplex salinum TaxID=1710538 RepID=UPI000F4A107F|nr:hypothetical protein [Halosimplex salinum]